MGDGDRNYGLDVVLPYSLRYSSHRATKRPLEVSGLSDRLKFEAVLRPGVFAHHRVDCVVEVGHFTFGSAFRVRCQRGTEVFSGAFEANDASACAIVAHQANGTLVNIV